MESIVCLRSAALNIILPFQNHTPLLSLPHRPAGRLPVVGHPIFPGWGRPRLHPRVSCSSHVPPPPAQQGTPKRDDIVVSKQGPRGGWKGPRAAAAGAAVIVACALGAVYMSRGPPARANGETPQASVPVSTRDSNVATPVQKLRGEVYAILFRKDDRGQTKSTYVCRNWFVDHDKYDAAFPLIEILLARRDYHGAKAVCEEIFKFIGDGEQLKGDLRPRLLRAVIDMMLAVEAMLLPDPTKDANQLIGTAKKSWEKYQELEKIFGSTPPLC